MSAVVIACVAFAVIFGGALFGMWLRSVLPEPHLNTESRDVVRLSTGLIATLAALVLGLLIATAQSSFQTQSNQIKQITANIVLLDNLLARSGPQARPTRVLLRSSVDVLVGRIWREQNAAAAKVAPFEASAQSDLFFDKLLEAPPQNDGQPEIRARAVQIGLDLAQTRILFAQSGSAIPMPFVLALVFWLTIIFTSFGLFAAPNATVLVSLGTCAFSASVAIFLILEMSSPFSGLMAISSAPLSSALMPLPAL
jgi:hypothetical protein